MKEKWRNQGDSYIEEESTSIVTEWWEEQSMAEATIAPVKAAAMRNHWSMQAGKKALKIWKKEQERYMKGWCWLNSDFTEAFKVLKHNSIGWPAQGIMRIQNNIMLVPYT